MKYYILVLIFSFICLELCYSSPLSGEYILREKRGAQSHTLTVCRGQMRSIACPNIQLLHVYNAFYGKLSGHDCQDPVTQLRDQIPTCFSTNAPKIIRESCQGQQSCDLYAEDNLYDNPCPSVTKYLFVSFTCQGKSELPEKLKMFEKMHPAMHALALRQPSVENTRAFQQPNTVSDINAPMNAVVCAGQTGSIFCPQLKLLKIKSAIYGKQQNRDCTGRITRDSIPTCYAKDTMMIIKNMCEGQQSCDLFSEQGLYGKTNCELNVPKYLQVEYICEGHSELEGKLASVDRSQPKRNLYLRSYLPVPFSGASFSRTAPYNAWQAYLAASRAAQNAFRRNQPWPPLPPQPSLSPLVRNKLYQRQLMQRQLIQQQQQRQLIQQQQQRQLMQQQQQPQQQQQRQLVQQQQQRQQLIQRQQQQRQQIQQQQAGQQQQQQQALQNTPLGQFLQQQNEEPKEAVAQPQSNFNAQMASTTADGNFKWGQLPPASQFVQHQQLQQQQQQQQPQISLPVTIPQIQAFSYPAANQAQTNIQQSQWTMGSAASHALESTQHEDASVKNMFAPQQQNTCEQCNGVCSNYLCYGCGGCPEPPPEQQTYYYPYQRHDAGYHDAFAGNEMALSGMVIYPAPKVPKSWHIFGDKKVARSKVEKNESSKDEKDDDDDNDDDDDDDDTKNDVKSRKSETTKADKRTKTPSKIKRSLSQLRYF